MRTILAFLAVAGHCLLAVQAGPISNALDVKALCEGAKDFEITTASQIAGFVAQLNKGTQCPELIKSTLTDLDQIIQEGHKDICSHDAVELIRNYLKKHVHTNHQLPKTMERFVISFFMKIAHDCKVSMVKQLSAEKIGDLTDEDFSSLEEWIKENGDIDELLDSAADSNNILLPSDLLSILKHTLKNGKLVANPKIQADVKKIHERCNKRFRPVYAPVLMPTVILSRAGFNKPDLEIRKEVGLTEKQERQLDRFNRIVYLCETMDMMAVDGEPENKLEQLHYESPSKVVVEEVKLIDDEHIRVILTNWYRHQDEILIYRRELFDKAIKSITKGLSKEEAEDTQLAVMCMFGGGKEVLRDAPIPEAKKQCGVVPAATAFTYIFTGTLLSAGMMMISGGD